MATEITSISAAGSDDRLKHLLRHFPLTSYAFAYGSAVFAQQNQQIGKMVDLIFVVDNPTEWHTDNLKMNPSHYSFLKYLGPKAISSIQENLACGVYYNTFANVDEMVLKYGVISTDAVLDDLLNWTHAYIPGRLHKPVRELQHTTNSDLVKYVRVNHEFALRASLLQLGRVSTKFELYYAITELSYIGDSRMIMGEHPNKVQNIVASNLGGFDEIYVPLISQLHPLVRLTPDDLVIQEMSPASRCQHLVRLPSHLQQHIAHKYKGGGLGSGLFTTYEDIDLIMVQLSTDPTADIPQILRGALGNLVWISSLRQTVTGFLSTGVFGSLRYALEKFKKAFFSD